VTSTPLPTSQTSLPIHNITESGQSTIQDETIQSSDQYITSETTTSAFDVTMTTHPLQQTTSEDSSSTDITSSSQISLEPETTIESFVTDDVTSIPTPDPCFNYSPLPNAYERYYLNAINGSTEVHVHDRHLPEGWYRAGHSLDMPNIPPSLLHCGTTFPIWMDGKF
jgi:hypothetical protein